MATIQYMGWETHQHHESVPSLEYYFGIKICICRHYNNDSMEHCCILDQGYFPATRDVMLDDEKARNLLSSYFSIMGISSPASIEEIIFHYRNTHSGITRKTQRDLPVIVFRFVVDLTWMDFNGDDEAAARAVEESMEADACKPIPAAKCAIDALEKVMVDGVTGTGTCVICLENLAPRQQVTRMPCSHMFHGDCIVTWLETSNLCPLCRFEMPTQLSQGCDED